MSSFDTPYSKFEIYSLVPVSMEEALAVGAGKPPACAAEYMSCCHTESGAWDRRSNQMGPGGSPDPAA